MTRTVLLVLASTLVLSGAGCQTRRAKNQASEASRINFSKQFLSKLHDPRRYWLSVSQGSDGEVVRDGYRLHPNQTAYLEAKPGKDLPGMVPLVKINLNSLKKTTLLLDFSEPYSWCDYSEARKREAVALGYKEPISYSGPRDLSFQAYRGLLSQLKFDQMLVESALVYVLMTDQGLGPLAREQDVEMVLGYEFLREFEFIQLDYESNKIRFSTTKPFPLNEDLLIAEADLLENEPVCSVSGKIYGKPTKFVLDPIGEFALAMANPTNKLVKQISVGELVDRNLPVTPLPVERSLPHLGREILQNFRVTICPQKGKVYFERFSR